MDKTNQQDFTQHPDYVTTLSEVYQYILSDEWGKTKDQPANKAEEQNAKHPSPKAS